ncbi:hypothetical protein K458DRAFT_458142 [Lentithecium fluviatile CBS 122367]|uniref:Uncharacterized protein n=1 Tax=Lentithecium fluviatile CBS 122367 TaxID=1168545 RepID=A0A6G1IQV8_9PLEO|nr:hypothetical protein K458DRAFT_458142 [Lentithecium fluviatile CBS 122367]
MLHTHIMYHARDLSLLAFGPFYDHVSSKVDEIPTWVPNVTYSVPIATRFDFSELGSRVTFGGDGEVLQVAVSHLEQTILGRRGEGRLNEVMSEWLHKLGDDEMPFDKDRTGDTHLHAAYFYTLINHLTHHVRTARVPNQNPKGATLRPSFPSTSTTCSAAPGPFLPPGTASLANSKLVTLSSLSRDSNIRCFSGSVAVASVSWVAMQSIRMIEGLRGLIWCEALFSFRPQLLLLEAGISPRQADYRNNKEFDSAHILGVLATPGSSSQYPVPSYAPLCVISCLRETASPVPDVSRSVYVHGYQISGCRSSHTQSMYPTATSSDPDPIVASVLTVCGLLSTMYQTRSFTNPAPSSDPNPTSQTLQLTCHGGRKVKLMQGNR